VLYFNQFYLNTTTFQDDLRRMSKPLEISVNGVPGTVRREIFLLSITDIAAAMLWDSFSETSANSKTVL